MQASPPNNTTPNTIQPQQSIKTVDELMGKINELVDVFNSLPSSQNQSSQSPSMNSMSQNQQPINEQPSMSQNQPNMNQQPSPQQTIGGPNEPETLYDQVTKKLSSLSSSQEDNAKKEKLTKLQTIIKTVDTNANTGFSLFGIKIFGGRKRTSKNSKRRNRRTRGGRR